MDVTIIQTGTANLASVLVAFERLGYRASVSSRPEDVRDAKRVVLPGVGTFASGRSALDDSGVLGALAERVSERRPTLGICLGLQLLAAASDESPGVCGMGVISERVSALDDSAAVPQMGWNRVEGTSLVDPGWAYFANSFAFLKEPEGWDAAWSCHGAQRFVASLESGGVLACQFHPELSGDWGALLLKRWAEGASC